MFAKKVAVCFHPRGLLALIASEGSCLNWCKYWDDEIVTG